MFATCGSAQVGKAFVGLPQGGAGIWFGTPDSFVSLAAYLPAGYVESTATSVAFDGQTYYVGGYATNVATNMHEAFLWVGVPEPAAGLVVLAGMLGMRRRR